MTKPKLTTSVVAMNAVNIHASFGSSPKACTDWTTPDRVRNVPKMVRKKVVMTSDMFHTRSIPRRSCTITEWRNAVAVNHGCLLYTSDAADERSSVDLGGRRIIKK